MHVLSLWHLLSRHGSKVVRHMHIVSIREECASWQRLAEGYLAKRESLCLAMVLQDVRRSWSEDEALLLEWLAERDVPGRVVLTKTDKLKLMKRKEAVKKLRASIGDGFGKPIATSSQKGDGLDVVWRTCFEFAYPERFRDPETEEAPALTVPSDPGD